MKKISILFFLIFGTIFLNAQKIIINDTVFNRGFYRSFNELKHNAPSLEFNCAIDSITNHPRDGDVTYHRVVIDKATAKSLGVIYGFCDGKNIYIRWSDDDYIPRSNFMKLQYLGNYCYFEDVKTSYSGQYSFSWLDTKVLNIYTGEVISVNKTNIRPILADAPELLAAFENEKERNKNSLVKEYLLKYYQSKNK